MNLRCFLFEATKEMNMNAENQRQMQLLSKPDICQFWSTTALFSSVKVHQKVHKFATKLPRLAKILRSLCKKRHQLEESTPPPVVAVVTNMSYACEVAASRGAKQKCLN